MNIFAQILGFVATLTSILAFQLKTHKQIMVAQIATSGVFIIHYILLGGYAGAAINVVAVVRNIVFYNRDKKIFASRWWTAIFAVLITAVGSIFAVSEGWVALFFIVGMVLNTISFSMVDPQKVRVLILFAAPMLLVYNILLSSVAGSVNEVLGWSSAAIGLIRYRKKKT